MARFSSAVSIVFLGLFSLSSAQPVKSGRELEERSMSGKATWYTPGLGSCGQADTESDLVVALATTTMAGGKHCNKSIKITNNTGRTAIAKVRDSCPACAAGDLDMSPALFKKFKSLDVGVFNVKWDFE